MGGKRGVKEYWEELMKDHARLVEDAEEQVEEFKVAMVSQRERERMIVSFSLFLYCIPSFRVLLLLIKRN